MKRRGGRRASLPQPDRRDRALSHAAQPDEFQAAMPGVALEPYPVEPQDIDLGAGGTTCARCTSCTANMSNISPAR